MNGVERIGVEMNIDNERNTKFKYFPKISSLGYWNICGTYKKKYNRGEGKYFGEKEILVFNNKIVGNIYNVFTLY